MNPERQREVIAERDGWKKAPPNSWHMQGKSGHLLKCNYNWTHPDGMRVFDPPDYLNDLNAIHAVTLKLGFGHEAEMYILNLWEVIGRQRSVGFMHALLPRLLPVEMFVLHHATAAQRCEAYLRAIGKWEE